MRSEYRLSLPEQIDARQLVLALGAAPASGARPAVPTLREFWPRFIAQFARANRQKPRGIASKESHWKHHLEPLLGDRRLDEIRAAEIQALKAALGARSAKTTNNVLSTLSKLLKVAVEWEVLAQLPATILPLRTQDPEFRFYDRAQFGELILGARGVGRRELAALLIGGDCGLRMGEIIALEWGDVDLERGKIHVRRAESKGEVTTPKNGKSRVVPFTADVERALRDLPPATARRVFLNDAGESLSEQNIRTWLCRAQRKAGLEVRGALHVLRHTYCSHLAMAGVPMLAIKELAGHLSARTTQRYMHLAPAEKDRAINALERWRTDPAANTLRT